MLSAIYFTALFCILLPILFLLNIFLLLFALPIREIVSKTREKKHQTEILLIKCYCKEKLAACFGAIFFSGTVYRTFFFSSFWKIGLLSIFRRKARFLSTFWKNRICPYSRKYEYFEDVFWITLENFPYYCLFLWYASFWSVVV